MLSNLSSDLSYDSKILELYLPINDNLKNLATNNKLKNL